MNRLTVLLPAYNEAKAIAKVIDDINKFITCDIVVANNGSTDDTGNICKAKGVNVLELKEKGKGGAIRSAFKQVSTPYCVMLDSDYTYPAKYIPAVLAELVDGADVVLGYRARKAQRAMPFINSVGNEVLSLLASLLYNHRMYDVCTGLWGFRKEAIEKLDLVSTGFTLEADIFSNAKKNHCNIVQIPIEYRARLNGSETKLRLSDGFKIAWFLTKNRIGK